MNLRWLWLDHFPPGIEIPASIKREAKRRARKHRRTDPSYKKTRQKYLTRVLPLGVLLMIWPYWGQQFLFGSSYGWATANIPTIGFLAVVFYTLHRTNVPFIRKALNDLGYPVCIDCGYWLRGLDESIEKCPECGAKREVIEHDESETEAS